MSADAGRLGVERGRVAVGDVEIQLRSAPHRVEVVGDKIFISYRRQDAEADAGRLHADLVREFGEGRVFKDVDDIPIGGSVADQIAAAVATSSVVVVLIGPDWSPERLFDTSDWVRIEIASAVEQSIPIIPVLLRRARMPDQLQLPADVAQLVDFNAAEIEHASWRRDLKPLIEAIHQTVSTGPKAGPSRQPGLSGWRRTGLFGVSVAAIGAITIGLAMALGGASDPDDSTTTLSALPIPTTVSDTATTGVTTVGASTTSASEDPGQAPLEVIPLTVDGPFVEIESPAMLSDGGFVYFPEPSAGTATVTFTPSNDGNYVVWARVRIPAGVADPADGNSLFVVAGSSLSRADEFIWDFWEGRTFPQPGVWEWDRVSIRGAAGSHIAHDIDPFIVDGRQGSENTFTIGGRERGVAIDQLYVTNDPGWQPPECAVSTVCPTREVDTLD